MTYENTMDGVFLSRPNRFIAEVEADGRTIVCHVKNTGRCREILVPGTPVVLARGLGPNRKTEWDLMAAWKGDLLINIDSQAPNKAFAEWAAAGGFLPGITLLQREKTYGNSRFDFYIETNDGGRHFVEVKGVTLEAGGRVLFPDAPTERGVKHVEELISAQQGGYHAHAVFVIQLSPAVSFQPNDATHPAFGQALRKAAKAGVDIRALCCVVTPNSMVIDTPVPVVL